MSVSGGDAVAAAYVFDELSVGQTFDASYTITPAVYEGFLGSFGDRSPVHVDATEAERRGFAGRVMHGAILNGFLSHFIGMVMPGRNALLLSVELRYSRPSYLGDRLRLRATIDQKVDTLNVVAIRVTFENETQGTVAGNGRAQVKVSS